MMGKHTRIAMLGMAIAIVGGLAYAASRPNSSVTPVVTSPGAEPPATAPAERLADQDGVKKAVASFTAAFQKGDAKAVAEHWTMEGEYVADDGTTFRGRAALEKAYGEFFTKNPGNSLDVEIETIRFPSRETAVVEGHFKLRKGKAAELHVSKCSFLYVREDSKWLIAIAREWPGDGHSLRDLEFLIGTWEAKREGVSVTTKYEWTANKSFIRCHFSITTDGQTHVGMQMIGKDPASGALRIWTFEDSGGIGDTEVVRDGKKWIFSGRGVMTDGRVLTATNILTPLDADSFLWQSVGRSLDDEPLPDQAPIKVVRVANK